MTTDPVLPDDRPISRLDPGAILDRLVGRTDARLRRLPTLVRPREDALPRRPFAAGTPLAEQLHMFMTPVRPSLRNAPALGRLMWRVLRSERYYGRPVTSVSTTASETVFAEVEACARSLGALDIGYVSGMSAVGGEILDNGGVPHDNAVVFIVEMAKENIDLAPSAETFGEVARGYGTVAAVSNAVSDLLRRHGHSAYPGTALGGLTDYVAVAERAGLGAAGYHGLLIAPGSGARLRIGTVYTDIENLPVPASNPHAWVRDFCEGCRRCVRSCPPGAILDSPRPRPGGGATSIDSRTCNDFFSVNHGCAICVKVCPFSHAGYDTVKAGHDAATSRP